MYDILHLPHTVYGSYIRGSEPLTELLCFPYDLVGKANTSQNILLIIFNQMIDSGNKWNGCEGTISNFPAHGRKET